VGQHRAGRAARRHRPDADRVTRPDPGARSERYGRIGDAIPRVEDRRLVTGAGRFTDDVAVPGMLHAAFLRSPHAHASIRSIDASGALEHGAVAVFTADDLAAAGIAAIPNPAQALGPDFPNLVGSFRPNPPWFPLARGKVRHVGETVALIVAPSLFAAREAAEHVMVDYEPLPVVTELAAAAAPEAPLVWGELPGNLLFDCTAGDAAATDAAFARAAHVVELEVVNQRLVVNFLEPRGCLARYDGERIELHLGSQGVHLQAERIATALGLPREKIRVITGDVGGGFGARNTAYPEYVACAHAARTLGRPVKWLAERSESFVSDTQARDYLAQGALALDASGRILGLRVSGRCNLGAHLSPRQPNAIIGNIVRMLTGSYAIPAAYLALKGFVSNTVPVNVYRGVGRLEDSYLLERLIDRAAAILDIDRAELRRRNLIPTASMPWRTPTGWVYDCGDFARTFERVLATADWAGFPRRREAAASRGRLRGIGVASILEGAGGPPDEYAALTAKADGTIELGIGAQSQGQGHETSFAQVATELLDLPFASIRIISGDTDRIAGGLGSFASRSMIKAGGAIVEAGRALLVKAKERAAEHLEAAAADLAYAAGIFRVVGTDRDVSLAALAAAAPLEAEARHRNEATSWPNGSHVCEVEIDPETGQVEIQRYVAVDDVGRAVNPMIVHGQTMGGVAQGIGQALLERCVYDPESGQLWTGSLLDYALPRAGDLPNFETDLADLPTATNALGVKGAGEAGTVAAPCAAMSAVLDALAPLGVTHLDMPATPERVWAAIEAARRRR
jgi:carbon-monoxide dehydrogenase large subunit